MKDHTEHRKRAARVTLQDKIDELFQAMSKRDDGEEKTSKI